MANLDPPENLRAYSLRSRLKHEGRMGQVFSIYSIIRTVYSSGVYACFSITYGSINPSHASHASHATKVPSTVCSKIYRNNKTGNHPPFLSEPILNHRTRFCPYRFIVFLDGKHVAVVTYLKGDVHDKIAWIFKAR